MGARPQPRERAIPSAPDRGWETLCPMSGSARVQLVRGPPCRRSPPGGGEPGDRGCLPAGADARSFREHHSAWTREPHLARPELRWFDVFPGTKSGRRGRLHGAGGGATPLVVWSGGASSVSERVGALERNAGRATALRGGKFGRRAGADSHGTPSCGITSCRSVGSAFHCPLSFSFLSHRFSLAVRAGWCNNNSLQVSLTHASGNFQKALGGAWSSSGAQRVAQSSKTR